MSVAFSETLIMWLPTPIYDCGFDGVVFFKVMPEQIVVHVFSPISSVVHYFRFHSCMLKLLEKTTLHWTCIM